MNIGDKKIYLSILGYQETIVSSICITTIVYDFALTVSQSYKILVLIEEKNIHFASVAASIQSS